MKDELLEKMTQEIASNHRKIIDDWCKAYLAQLYEEGVNLKPGSFTLVEERDIRLENGYIGKKMWFERRTENDRL